jgi:Transposase IS4
MDHTNDHQNRPYDVLKPHARAYNWTPLSLGEMYAYLGIRIYIGLHPENQMPHYWREGPSYPSHPLKDVMSLLRFEAIHRSLRLYSDDLGVPLEGVFDRVSTINLYRN